MSQNYFWPAGSGGSSTNPSVGPNNTPIPGSSTLVAGSFGGVLIPLSVDALGDLNVNVVSSSPITGTVTANQGTPNTAANRWPVQITDGTDLALVSAAGALIVDGSAVTQPISAASLPLPTGAATEATLLSIDGKLNSLGQKASAGSVPVVIASDQSPIDVSVTNFPATQPISGTVTANQGTANSAANRWPVQITDGTDLALVSAAGALLVDGSGVTQPISAAALPLPAGAATEATLSAINGKLNSLGQKTMANSVPVVLASDQSSVPVAATPVTPAALTVKQAAITVGTTAVRLTADGAAPSASRVVLVATPDSASTAKFYIGSASVTNSGGTRGAQITSSQIFSANGDAGDYYIISDTAAQTVYIMEQE